MYLRKFESNRHQYLENIYDRKLSNSDLMYNLAYKISYCTLALNSLLYLFITKKTLLAKVYIYTYIKNMLDILDFAQYKS